jgi:hypothetical protein
MEHPGKGKRAAPNALVKNRGARGYRGFLREKRFGIAPESRARAEARALI